MRKLAEPQLSNLMGYNPYWFWFISFLILAAGFITVFIYLKIRSNNKHNPQSKLFIGYGPELDRIFLMVNSGNMSIPEACQRVSLILRKFFTEQTNVPAENMTLNELKKANAPIALLRALEFSYPIVFSTKQITNYDEFLQYMNSSRAIIDGWWG